MVADITITYEREQGVDFTMPFMNLGVTILYKKPTKKDPNLFSFLSPLSFDVWIYIITAYLAVSLLLFTISRYVWRPAATFLMLLLPTFQENCKKYYIVATLYCISVPNLVTNYPQAEPVRENRA